MSGEANSARSSCVCTSMNPGATIRPATSISRAPWVFGISPTAAMRSPATATSARKRAAPVPSITVPPRRIQSVIAKPIYGWYLAAAYRLSAALRSASPPRLERCSGAGHDPGEATKDLAHFGRLVDDILALGIERGTMLVALGGGVVGDIAGFAAATLLRGIDFVQIPTTLLAQVDSSVGGKTAINTAAGKNLLGAFYQPRLVLADTATLATLPRRELRAGYAEILKYGLIRDPAFFDWLEANGDAVCDLEPTALT